MLLTTELKTWNQKKPKNCVIHSNKAYEQVDNKSKVEILTSPPKTTNKWNDKVNRFKTSLLVDDTSIDLLQS